MEENVLHRYHIELNSDYPIIEKILPSYETKWDDYKNDKMKSRNRVNDLISRFILFLSFIFYGQLDHQHCDEKSYQINFEESFDEKTGKN